MPSEQGWLVLHAHRANKLALSIYESETLALDELRRRHADAPVDEIVARMVANGNARCIDGTVHLTGDGEREVERMLRGDLIAGMPTMRWGDRLKAIGNVLGDWWPGSLEASSRRPMREAHARVQRRRLCVLLSGAEQEIVDRLVLAKELATLRQPLPAQTCGERDCAAIHAMDAPALADVAPSLAYLATCPTGCRDCWASAREEVRVLRDIEGAAEGGGEGAAAKGERSKTVERDGRRYLRRIEAIDYYGVSRGTEDSWRQPRRRKGEREPKPSPYAWRYDEETGGVLLDVVEFERWVRQWLIDKGRPVPPPLLL